MSKVPVYIGQAQVARHLGVSNQAVFHWFLAFTGHCQQHDDWIAECAPCQVAQRKKLPRPDAYLEYGRDGGSRPLWLSARLREWEEWARKNGLGRRRLTSEEGQRMTKARLD